MIFFNKETENKIYSSEEFDKLDGFIQEDIAKASLAKFLYNNLGFCVEMLYGIRLYAFQEIILRGWFDKNFNMFIASRGASKCLDKKSIVLTRDGFDTLENLNIGDRVWSDKGLQTVLGKTLNPPETGVTVTTTSGYSITGKNEHRLLVYNSQNVTFEYKFLRDVIPGEDFVPIRNNMNCWGNFPLSSLFSGNESKAWENTMNLKEEDDLFYLFGLLLGDGCLRPCARKSVYRFSISTSDEEIKTFITNKYAQYFPDSKVWIQTKKDNLASDYWVCNPQFVRFLTKVGFNVSLMAHEKIIPPTLLKCKKEFVFACLRGLYDTDGYVNINKAKGKNKQKCTIGLTSSSYELVKAVQNVLLNAGIKSRLYVCHKGGDYVIQGKKCWTQKAYTLAIGSYPNILKFSQLIGFKIERKQEKIDRYLSEFKGNGYDADLIPNLGTYLKSKYSAPTLKKVGYNPWKHANKQRVEFLLTSNVLDDSDRVKFRNLLSSDYFFEEIKTKENTLTETIDIQVENEECYWSNGFINHNSFLSAVFCSLYPIFYPETKIIISSNSFRATRQIITQMERFINYKGAGLLRQCYTSKTGRLEFKRHSDEYVLECGESVITALPLNEKIRGFRASLLVCDEFRQISEEMFKSVLLPFLTAGSDIQQKMKDEDEKIELLQLPNFSREDKDMLSANKKLLAMTSAGYNFEHCYRVFSSWIQRIEEQTLISKKYFVTRMSYEALPESLVEKDIVEIAKSGGAESASFQMEFMAHFASTSDGYFNIKKLHDNTVPPGDLPCVQIKGDRDNKYILSIDPSSSGAASSDFFAMTIHLLNSNERTITQVHSYAKAGGDLKEHIKYLYYLLSYFNVVFIVADLGGANLNFIHAANESSLFLEHGIKLDFIDGNFDAEDYIPEVRLGKNSYNLTIKRICLRQIFSSEWLRKSNEYLQVQIDRNKVKFASPLAGHEKEFKRASEIDYPLLFPTKIEQETKFMDFVADQDALIEETKSELALIECKVTSLGTMTFDLPQHMRRSKSPQRKRRDLYTTTLLSAWGAKVYWDIFYTEEKRNTELFIPRLI